MTINLGKAITCLGQEPKVVKKIIGLGFILFLIPFIEVIVIVMSGFSAISIENFIEEVEAAVMSMPMPMLAAFLMALPGVVYVTGFLFQSMHKTFNSDRFQMVEFSQKNLLVESLKNFFSMVGYFILVGIIMSVVTTLLTIVIAIIVFGVLFLSNIINPAVESELAIGSAIAVKTVFGLYFIQFLNAAFTCYLKTLKFSDLIAFNKHFSIIKNNQHASWTLIGKMILYFLLLILVIVVLSATVIGILLVPFVVVAAQFVYFNLLDQYAKQIQIEKYL